MTSTQRLTQGLTRRSLTRRSLTRRSIRPSEAVSSAWLRQAVLVLGLCLSPILACAQVYRCDTDSGVPLYQNAPGPRCKPLNLPSLSTIPAPKLPAQPPRQGAVNGGAAPGAVGGSAGNFPRVDASAQKSRDSDRRAILGDELRSEEARLAELRTEYNNGEPERLGSERNYQRYLDRVQRLKDDIARTEASIASLRRELGSVRD